MANTMYTFTNQFISNEKNYEFLKTAMMGQNAMRVAEELASYLDINKNMRILDLGIAWWKDLWSEAEGIEIADISEMNCCKQAWDEWLASPNPYAVSDMKMMEAEGGKYFNLIRLIAKVI